MDQISRNLLNGLSRKTGRRDFLRDLAEAFQPVFRFSWLSVTFRDQQDGFLADYSCAPPKLNPVAPVLSWSVNLALAEIVRETRAPLVIPDCVEYFLEHSPPPVFQFNLASAIALPLVLNDEVFASLQLGYETRPDDLGRLAALAEGFGQTVAAALGVILLLERGRRERPDREPPAAARLPARLPSELRLYDGLVFRSPVMLNVFQQVSLLAKLDVPILLLGETGTGKSMIARHIHENSFRAAGHFVRVNCPSLASGLFESEMFGHAKGSFTGATRNRIGRFELAHNGTLFLDEVAELSLDMQSKLLQVLDDSSFERVGESEPILVDMRIVAATNVHVGEAISQGRLRADLFHRISVYTIELPPLRRRPEDIEPLARSLSAQSADRLGLPDLEYGPAVLGPLVDYHWPGNTRELSNLMTRLVIARSVEGELSSARVRETIERSESYFLAENAVSRPAAQPAGARPAVPEVETLAEMERGHILKALERTGGVVAGPKGAARLLGLPRSTLLNRMKKMGLPGA
ncbi:MAG: sigma-54 dependent transcriptional regulator [Candidatus Adiutrix sp.]|nr:sigma-54 dependent transcriptional regulator [Candidatus Adiutrix sp.]